MLNIDDWVWERSNYWWELLNRSYHTLYELPTISITDRLASRAGCCRVKKNKLEIVFYEHYINKEQTKYDQTIGHELAHAHNYCHYHRMSHGGIWQEAMRKIGLPALRCHNYGSPTKTPVVCLCGEKFGVGKIQIKRIMRGVNYHCHKCKRKIIYLNGMLTMS